MRGRREGVWAGRRIKRGAQNQCQGSHVHIPSYRSVGRNSPDHSTMNTNYLDIQTATLLSFLKAQHCGQGCESLGGKNSHLNGGQDFPVTLTIAAFQSESVKKTLCLIDSKVPERRG